MHVDVVGSWRLQPVVHTFVERKGGGKQAEAVSTVLLIRGYGEEDRLQKAVETR